MRLRPGMLLWAWSLVAACRAAQPQAGPASPAPSGLDVRPLDTPAPAGSQTPNLAPSADGGVLLSWVEARRDGGRALVFSHRRGGQPWSAPREVTAGRDGFTNWADFPSMAALSDGSLVAHWLQRAGPGSDDYGVRLSRSTDGGATWSAPVSPHARTPGEHGFVSLLPRPGGRLDVVWLDGRATKDGAGQTALMRASLDGEFRPGPEQTLDPRTCDCCQTAAVAAGEAALVAYRDRSEHELRDIAVLRLSGDRAAAAAALERDGWEIHGCPVNGPALSAEGRDVAVAWFTGAAGRSQVRLAFSSDGGASFGAPVEVSGARPLGRVGVAAASAGEAFVAWLERVGDGAELRLQRFGAQGALGPASTVAHTSLARQAGFPRLERAGRELVLAWTEVGDPPRVRTAVAAF